MFWKRSTSLNELRLLQWWRTPQEYVDWTEVDVQAPFSAEALSDQQEVLVEMDEEVSVLSKQADIRGVFEQLKKIAQKNKVVTQTADAELILKSTQIGEKKFLVRPFLQFRRSVLPFSPPKWLPLTPHLTVVFLHPSESMLEFDRRLQHWMQVFQTDQIDQFVYRRAEQLFQELLKNQVSETRFDALINILNQFDLVILKADGQLSHDYLKQVWRVPQFIFANQPEQAAFTRLLLQKSFQRQYPELKKMLIRRYWEQFLNWTLFRPFNQQEQEKLVVFIQAGDGQLTFIQHELFHFYQFLLQRCGVPIELGALYGTDRYVSLVLKAFSQFPKNESFEDTLNQGELYAILLEESVKFVVHHTRQVSGTPKELLRTLIGMMIKRIAEFSRAQEEVE